MSHKGKPPQWRSTDAQARRSARSKLLKYVYKSNGKGGFTKIKK